MSDTDRIEPSVEIDADVITVHDPTHGAFRIRTVTLEEPSMPGRDRC